MDQDTYEQPAIPADVIGDATDYLKENLVVKLTLYQSEPLDIELPITVDLAVVEAEIAVRGDTATGVNKKVTTETGLIVQVPNFIEVDDIIRVDTRSGTYITRV
jgi:elongation factor P